MSGGEVLPAVREQGALERPAGGGTAAALTRLSPDEVAILRETYAKDATDAELAVFLAVASEHKLNPFVGEVWLVKRKATEPASIQVGRDGYLAHAERHPGYDGMQSDVVHANDHFEVEILAGKIEHRYGAGDRGPITGAYAIVWRRDRRTPFYFFAPFEEFRDAVGQDAPLWKRRPSQMIQKSAEKGALQRAFRISVDDATVADFETSEQRIDRIREENRLAAPEDGGPVFDASTGEIVDGTGENAWRSVWNSFKATAAHLGMTRDDLDELAARHGADRPSDVADETKAEAIRTELAAKAAAAAKPTPEPGPPPPFTDPATQKAEAFLEEGTGDERPSRGPFVPTPAERRVPPVESAGEAARRAEAERQAELDAALEGRRGPEEAA